MTRHRFVIGEEVLQNILGIHAGFRGSIFISFGSFTVTQISVYRLEMECRSSHTETKVERLPSASLEFRLEGRNEPNSGPKQLGVFDRKGKSFSGYAGFGKLLVPYSSFFGLEMRANSCSSPFSPADRCCQEIHSDSLRLSPKDS